jgi:UrcA family protein
MNTVDACTQFPSTQGRRLVVTAVLGAFVAACAGLSAAADGVFEHSVTVNYGDLNLSNPQGAKALYSRIVSAAHDVCDMSENLAQLARQKACRDKAIADAVTKVGSPALIAVYNAKNRQRLAVNVAAR